MTLLSPIGQKMAAKSGLRSIMDDIATSMAGTGGQWLNLSIGNPAAIPPVTSAWRQLTEEALATDFEAASCSYGPSRGSHVLVAAIVDYFNQAYRWDIGPENVVVGPNCARTGTRPGEQTSRQSRRRRAVAGRDVSMRDHRLRVLLTATARSARASLRPLEAHAFRLLWIGRTVSSAGDAAVEIALVFAILHVGGNAADIGLVAALQGVARTVFILAGGVWADRMRRQYVMVTSDTVRAAVEGCLAVLLIAGLAHVWQIAVAAAMMGAAGAFFGPASTGLVPETVAAEQLQKSNALLSFSDSFFSVVSPAGAGLLIAVFGPGPLFAVDALTYVVSAIALSRLKLAPRKMPERSSFRAELATGWREIKARSWYWTSLIAHALWNFAIPAYFVLGPVIAARMLGGASAWGAISAAWAAGAVLGGIVALHAKPGSPLVTANLALTLTALPVLALALRVPTWAIAAAAAVGGIGLTILMTLWTTTMQQLIPDEIRSRVDSYDWLLSLITMPVGFAIVGPLASKIGDQATLIGASVLLAVPCVLVVAVVPAIRAVRRTRDGAIVGPAPHPVSRVPAART